MPTIIVVTPIVGWSWPALAPLLIMGAAYIGFKMIFDSRERGELDEKLRKRLLEERSIELNLGDVLEAAIFEDVRRGDAMYFQKDDMLLGVMKDERGHLKITISGSKATPRRELEKLGEEFAAEIAQLFAQNRVVEQLARLNFEIVNEQKEENGDIVLKARRWS